MPADSIHYSDNGLVSQEVQAMALAWSRGERVLADDVLARLPGLGDEETVRLIYEEVSLRRESGEDVATTEVVSRYPRYKDELEVLLGCDRMLRPFSRVALFPSVPGELGPFRLITELGQGASGMTYLAEEPALGGRFVVLKVIRDNEQEHLSLARLQHTHIVPLFSEQTFPDRGLRALCMPYQKGATLARLLEVVATIPPAARQGRHLVEALDRVEAALCGRDSSGADQPGGAPEPEPPSPYRRFLEQASYADAVCWIVACLADGLHSAHAHGLVHLDVKPSNVLIAGNGLPMLLDFHLARRPVGSGEHVTDRLGGTPGWMAPEHRLALEAVRRGEAVSQPVDERADIFSLGLLLREALGASASKTARPVEHFTGRRWRKQNPRISVGLADIVEKSLAIRSCDRYQSAAALANDLRRHLSDLPLEGVANRSLTEAWRKWRRRRPASLARWAACVAIAAALAAGIGTSYLTRSLDQQLAILRLGQRAVELHEIADRVRFRFGAELPDPDEARALAQKIGSLWRQRRLVLPPHSTAGALEAKTEQSIRTDLLDLAIIYSEIQAGAGLSDAARRTLDEAEASCGRSRRIDLTRQALGGASAFANPDAAGSALAHYDLARADLRAGRFREAAAQLEQAIAERPQDFWPNFYAGLCAYRAGHFVEAHSAFRVCVALVPESAECYFNLARAAEAIDRQEEALRDYDRALRLDPRLTFALLNRAILAYKARRYDTAIDDLKRALDSTNGSMARSQIEYNLALAYLGRGTPDLALSAARAAASRGHEDAAKLVERLRRGS
jgi:serine/threonine protein kinase/tetratricopeptide (TPR) repeat protein